MALLACPSAPKASAQVSLADDIIIAAQGKENAERNRKSNLGRTPGTQTSPYKRSPGSSDVLLGVDPNRRLAPLPRLTQRPGNPAEVRIPGPQRAEIGHGLAPAIERLQAPPALPASGLAGPAGSSGEDDDTDEGPPDGLTLDAAIERLLRCSSELRSKSLEIPQADADVLTAGLRENPLLFYSSDSVPYGSYSKTTPRRHQPRDQRRRPFRLFGKASGPGHPGRTGEERPGAQYRNAVRLAIDDLGTAYVDVLAQRQAAQSAERGLALLDRLLGQAVANPPRQGPDRTDRRPDDRARAGGAVGGR